MGHHYLDENGPWQGIDDVEFATAQRVHWYNTTRPHSAIGMHRPVQHEQTYTPPDDNTAESDSNSEAMDIGEQTTSQRQPAATGAR